MKKTLALVALMLTTGSAYAQSSNIFLQLGESVNIGGRTVYCGGSDNGGGGGGGTVCNANPLYTRISWMEGDRDLISSGRCPKAYRVGHCGDRLEGHSVADVKNSVRNVVNQLRNEARALINSSACSYERYQILNAYNRLIDSLGYADLVYDNVQRTRLLENAYAYRL